MEDLTDAQIATLEKTLLTAGNKWLLEEELIRVTNEVQQQILKALQHLSLASLF